MSSRTERCTTELRETPRLRRLWHGRFGASRPNWSSSAWRDRCPSRRERRAGSRWPRKRSRAARMSPMARCAPDACQGPCTRSRRRRRARRSRSRVVALCARRTARCFPSMRTRSAFTETRPTPWPSRPRCGTPSRRRERPSRRSIEATALRVEPYGDRALLVTLGTEIDPIVNAQVHRLAAALGERRVEGLGVPVAAYASLLVPFDPDRVARDRAIELVRESVTGLGEVAADDAED